MTGGTGLHKGFGLETKIQRLLLFPDILIDSYSGEQKMFLYRIVLENHDLCSLSITWLLFHADFDFVFIIILVYKNDVTR